MLESGQAEQIIGDVCLKHVRNNLSIRRALTDVQLKSLKTLDPYRTYIANQDESQKTYQEMFKKHSRFVSFTDVSL